MGLLYDCVDMEMNVEWAFDKDTKDQVAPVQEKLSNLTFLSQSVESTRPEDLFHVYACRFNGCNNNEK